MNKKSQSPKTKSLLWAVVALVYSTPSFAEQPSLPEPKNGDCSGFKECQGNFNAEKRPVLPNGTIGPMWSLVAQRSANGSSYQVWYDSNTGLVWGDRLDSIYTHSVAPPNSPRATDAVVLDASGNVTKEIACASAEGQRANAGIGTKKFGLPTIQEYQQAEKDGIRQVLPNVNNHFFWSASLNSNSTDYAQGFNGNYGNSGNAFRYNGVSVRCVGR